MTNLQRLSLPKQITDAGLGVSLRVCFPRDQTLVRKPNASSKAKTTWYGTAGALGLPHVCALLRAACSRDRG